MSDDINNIKPINTTKGWLNKKEFIDNDGNVFNKGVFVYNNKDIVNEIQTPNLSEKNIYYQFIIEKIPFKIYINGQLIFESKDKSPIDFPIFNEDGFILLGKNYIYRGITIERY